MFDTLPAVPTAKTSINFAGLSRAVIHEFDFRQYFHSTDPHFFFPFAGGFSGGRAMLAKSVRKTAFSFSIENA